MFSSMIQSCSFCISMCAIQEISSITISGILLEHNNPKVLFKLKGITSFENID